jgi:hypothetical protein
MQRRAAMRAAFAFWSDSRQKMLAMPSLQADNLANQLIKKIPLGEKQRARQTSRPIRHPPSGPLAGFRIVEFAGIGPGPFACMLLADMGAEVVTLDRVGASKNLKAVAVRGRKVSRARSEGQSAASRRCSTCSPVQTR